jgi:hypothetical protein
MSIGARQTMQFYLESAVEESSLLSKLSSILGLVLHHIDDPEKGGDGACLFMRYRCGFELGISIVLRRGLQPKTNGIDAARELSRWTNAFVATDLPEYAASASDPYVWCVAQPDGSVFLVDEDTSEPGHGGLILDGKSRRPLDPGR